MTRRVLIEDSVIMPKEYDQFSVLFSSIYRKLASQYNKQAIIDSSSVFITNTPTLIASFDGTVDQTILIILVPEEDSAPTELLLYSTFSKTGGKVTTIFSSQSSDKITTTIKDKGLYASITPNNRTYRVKMLSL